MPSTGKKIMNETVSPKGGSSQLFPARRRKIFRHGVCVRVRHGYTDSREFRRAS